MLPVISGKPADIYTLTLQMYTLYIYLDPVGLLCYIAAIINDQNVISHNIPHSRQSLIVKSEERKGRELGKSGSSLNFQ